MCVRVCIINGQGKEGKKIQTHKHVCTIGDSTISEGRRYKTRPAQYVLLQCRISASLIVLELFFELRSRVNPNQNETSLNGHESTVAECVVK